MDAPSSAPGVSRLDRRWSRHPQVTELGISVAQAFDSRHGFTYSGAMLRLLITLCLASSLAAQDAVPLRLFWKEGLRAESEDGRFEVRLRARFENDWAWFATEDSVEAAVGPVEDGTEIRRARLGLQGHIYERIPFKAQVDFASGTAEFKSIYSGISGLPGVGNLRIGYFREPFGLERNTGTHYLTMMERASANAMTPGRNTGLMFFDAVADERFTWAAGFFRDTNAQGFGQGDDGIAGTARVSGIPWQLDESHFLHLGLAFSHREFGDQGVRFKARPGVHLAPSYVDTAVLSADRGEFVGIEAACLLGPTSVQAEHVQSWLSGVTGGAGEEFSGSYLQLAHFITGETRRFKRSMPSFVRVRPEVEALSKGQDGVGGAWEVALRIGHVDLDDRGTRGGTMVDYSCGLNWYLNPNVRVMSNLIYADLRGVGDSLIFVMRFGIDF